VRSNFLPEYLRPADDLCFLCHDSLVQLLALAEREGFFELSITFSESERRLLEETDDILQWLVLTNRTDARTDLIRRSVLHSLLSDFLHFLFEALDSARRVKLTVCYALLRKPLQDHLALFEALAVDLPSFVGQLEADALRLRAQKQGGPEVHLPRIKRALEEIGEADRFDAAYLAQLRYKKDADGFDGPCNQALHLFTEHKAIRTEPLNINFIFSGPDEWRSQWHYLYSRLPYVLVYARRLVQHLFEAFAPPIPATSAFVEQQVSAGVLLWAADISTEYRYPQLQLLVDVTRSRLISSCAASGVREPTPWDLQRMLFGGGLPGQYSPAATLAAAKAAIRKALRSRFPGPSIP
jgi:hypothetical protein